MRKNDIKKQIDNSIRSIFEMIVIIDDHDEVCHIIDYDKDLPGISQDAGKDGATVFYDSLRAHLIKNIHPADRDAFDDFFCRDSYVKAMREHVLMSMECRIRHSNARYYWSEIIICNTTEEDSTKGNDILLLIRDINSRKKKELKKEAEERRLYGTLKDQYDELFEENMTDQQTGCYNRKGLNHYTDIVLEDAKSNDRLLFVCVSDLNGLKHLNDTYGHAAGDKAIAAVAGELKKAAPTGSKVVRIGGDEFLIFASVDKNSSEPESFGAVLDKGINDYNAAHPHPYTVGASYGWVLLAPVEGMTSLDEFIEMADAKMYEMRVKRDKYRRD